MGTLCTRFGVKVKTGIFYHSFPRFGPKTGFTIFRSLIWFRSFYIGLVVPVLGVSIRKTVQSSRFYFPENVIFFIRIFDVMHRTIFIP